MEAKDLEKYINKDVKITCSNNKVIYFGTVAYIFYKGELHPNKEFLTIKRNYSALNLKDFDISCIKTIEEFERPKKEPKPKIIYGPKNPMTLRFSCNENVLSLKIKGYCNSSKLDEFNWAVMYLDIYDKDVKVFEYIQDIECDEIMQFYDYTNELLNYELESYKKLENLDEDYYIEFFPCENKIVWTFEYDGECCPLEEKQIITFNLEEIKLLYCYLAYITRNKYDKDLFQKLIKEEILKKD